MTRASIVLAAMIALHPAEAQVRADPGAVIGGKVAVRVNVTLSDDDTPYFPVAGLQLRFFRSATDSIVGRTDDGGSATVLVPAGEYRLVSGRPTEWKGVRFTWSLPLRVAPGLPAVELQPSNATVTQAAAVAVASATGASLTTPTRPPITGRPPSETQGSPREAEGSPPNPVPTNAALYRKDPTTATLLSFLITGAGQIYAGETGKGIGLLLLAGVGAGVAYEAALEEVNDCALYNCSSSGDKDAFIAGGLILAAGTWIYSMADAGAAARRFNMRLGIAASGVRPVIAPAPNGQRRLGFSVALPGGPRGR